MCSYIDTSKHQSRDFCIAFFRLTFYFICLINLIVSRHIRQQDTFKIMYRPSLYQFFICFTWNAFLRFLNQVFLIKFKQLGTISYYFIDASTLCVILLATRKGTFGATLRRIRPIINKLSHCHMSCPNPFFIETYPCIHVIYYIYSLSNTSCSKEQIQCTIDNG